MADVDKKVWFRAKRYGWGWGLPIAWQGWTVFVVWLAVFAVVTRYLLPRSVVLHLMFALMMILVLLGICYKKGEPPNWRWGDRDE